MADIQLFRERLSEKMHATIPKDIVGGFEFAVLQRNLKEWHERPWTYVCACQRKATKEVLTATVSGTVYWSHVAFPNRNKRYIPYYLSGSSRLHIAVYLWVVLCCSSCVTVLKTWSKLNYWCVHGFSSQEINLTCLYVLLPQCTPFLIGLDQVLMRVHVGMLISNAERQFSLRSLIYTHKWIFLFYPLGEAKWIQQMLFVE